MKLTMPFSILVVILGVLWAVPAQAESIRTFWRLEPVVRHAPNRVVFGEPFFEQRLLPVRLVKLTSPFANGDQTLATGTLLHLVVNDEGRVGYCPSASATTGGPAKLFTIPILNQRPCLVDSDGDGRFDKVFSAYQKYGGPPTWRGSINGATPVPMIVGYQQVDVRFYPGDLRVWLRLKGGGDPAKAKLGLKFSKDLGEVWPARRGTRTSGGTLFRLLNADVLVLGMEGESAKLKMQWSEDIYLSTNKQNTLFWGPLPRLVPRQ